MTIFDEHPDSAGQDMSFARFYTHAVEDVTESKLAGSPVFRNEPYVCIRLRDDPYSVIHERATEAYKRRWPREWAVYQQTEAVAAEGAPIETFPLLKPAMIATLKVHGVLTLEQLSQLEGEILAKLGPTGEEMRDRARQFLQGSGKTEKELRRKLAEKDQVIAGLRAEIDQLKAATGAPVTAAPVTTAAPAKRLVIRSSKAA